MPAQLDACRGGTFQLGAEAVLGHGIAPSFIRQASRGTIVGDKPLRVSEANGY
jgi:hypothetical protein